ncbi:MAG: LLM class flavin-dependent oxidoreductase [Pseudomonas sp.]|uniref:LLM class flavin-dependent oxidoreductase n=1 Tax=Pseudomonas sp. TaxID=306 RepID=UPI003D6DAF27
MSERQLSLNLFIYPNGHHEAAWRHPQSVPEASMDIGYYQQLALRAEREKLDAIFFADSPSLAENDREGLRIRFEPITWLAAIAAVTQRIGLIATASTTYSEPYNLARSFSALDHLSKGRAGWNIVTTSMAAAAANFGLDQHPSAHDRYAQAEEFVKVIGDLWDSWEDDALVLDKTAGVFANGDKVHSINHVGTHYRVKGPFNSPRSPQGRPVQVQAGSSEDGRDFASRHAEAIFTAHQTLQSATEFANDIRGRARAVGRDPRQLKILPGISPYIGSTEAEAQRKFDELNDLVLPHVSLGQLRRLLGVDLSDQDLDAPFPRHLVNFDGTESQSSRFKLIIDIVDREKPTLRQLINRLAGARGHWVPVGTPVQIADLIEQWFRSGAADGFNVMPPAFPEGFEVFLDEVLPILRKRGLFRSEYAGSTLREHYGLSRPVSRFALKSA